MRVKISNETSLSLGVNLIMESEVDIPEEFILFTDEISIEPSTRQSVQIFEMVPLEMGENTTIWIKLCFSHHFSKNECLYARIRFNGGSLGIKVLHNVSAVPFGSLLPEQPWHSGYAEVREVVS